MKLPLDSLELGSDTCGTLASSYFVNRATSKDELGKTRFELYKYGAEVDAEYYSTYTAIDGLYSSQIKEFADEIIKKINETSAEKLLDKDGNYTEYGQYVIDIIGNDIAKYAFLKSILGDKLQTKVMSDEVLAGKITYNYENQLNEVTLKSLGINEGTARGEAKALAKELAASGISVNAIAPGFINTPMNSHLNEDELLELFNDIPIGRAGSVEEVAVTVKKLSEMPSYVTGQILCVDGGTSL